MKIFIYPFLLLIRGYQKFISPFLPASCKYAPTCSQYAVESLQKHGICKGIVLILWRILRCNPWSKGGVDRVPKKGKWPKRPLGYQEIIIERQRESRKIASSNQNDIAKDKL